ncbi:oligosaccharide flippase family protein [Candidatus Woesearchaeota archaeon]|nr:oligosaccharide flippase family protein [Candidatus Woesearchaeota archaeon]
MRAKLNVVYYFLLNVLSKFGTYLLLLLLANRFSPESFGEARFVLSLFFVAGVLAGLGLPEALVPYFVNYRFKLPTLANLYLLINLVFLALGLIFFSGTPWKAALVISLPFYVFMGFAKAYYQSRHRHHHYQLINSATSLLPILFVLLLPARTVSSIIYAYAATFIIVPAATVLLSRTFRDECQKTLKVKLYLDELAEYLPGAATVSFFTISFLVLGWIDTFILGIFSSFDSVAKYNIAGPIANVVTLIPLSIAMFLLTRTAELKEERYAQGILHRGLRLSFSLSLLLAVAGISLMPLLLRLFFPTYPGIEPFVMILFSGILFYSVYYLLYTHLVGKLEQGTALMPMAVALLANIALDLLLIPRFDLLGITLATFIAHLLAFVLLSLRMGLLSRYWHVLPLSLFVLISYFLGYFGVLLLVLLIPLLTLLGYLKRQDLALAADLFKAFFQGKARL